MGAPENPKETLLAEAARRGAEYTATCGSCAMAVFSAVMEMLGYGDDPGAREVSKATVGLTGGTGCMAIGTCGALAGAAMAIGYSFGFTRGDLEGDFTRMLAVNAAVAELGKRLQQTYGHIQCQEIQFNLWGKSYRFTNPNALAEFVAFSRDEKSGFRCNRLSGEVSSWTAEWILKNRPGFSRAGAVQG